MSRRPLQEGDRVRVREGLVRGAVGTIEGAPSSADGVLGWPAVRLPGHIPPVWRCHPDSLEHVEDET